MKVAVSKRTRWAAVAAVGLGVLAYLLVPGLSDSLSNAIHIVAGNDTEQAVAGVRDYFLSYGVVAPLVSAMLMIAVQVAFLPIPTFFITFANGLLFGWLGGSALSWSSSMIGAALCFWIARSLGRPVIQKFFSESNALEVADLFFIRYGNKAVLTARLLPFVSFRAVSYGAGITTIGFWHFLAATAIGQLPGTLLYSYLGGQLTQSAKFLFWAVSITLAVAIIGTVVGPLFLKRLQRVAQPSEAVGAEQDR